MPKETQDAINWALQQKITNAEEEDFPITAEMPGELVDKVREYFNTQNIEYQTFSYADLLPYL